MGGLIVMCAVISVVPLLMWTTARSRLATVRSLVGNQPWPVIKGYTAGNRGYLRMRIADRVVTLSFGKERSTPALVVRVDLPAPGLPHFDITPRSLIGALVPDVLAGTMIALGVPMFDQQFRFRTREPAAAKGLWTAALGSRFRSELGDASVRADGEALILGLDPVVPDRDAVAAVKLALDIALAGVYGLDALRALPDATLHVTDGGLEVELPGASPIRLAPVRTPTGVVTVASVDEGVIPDLRPDLTALGEATLSTDGPRVTITWPGIEEDRGRLTAAVELLRTLGGAPHDGAYR